MSLVRNILRAAVALLALFAYVWFAGVRGLPRVKRRKAGRRRRSRVDRAAPPE